MKYQDQAKIKGEYTAISLPRDVERDDPRIQRMRTALRTGDRKTLSALKESGFIREEQYAENIIPTTGRNVLARVLSGDTTYSGEVDWGALGDTGTAFTNASTQLNNEVFRSQADSQAFDENITYIDWFIASGDVADQTFEEFGAFIDGTASADSGQAWSLLVTGGWTKSGAMFISAKYTLI